MSKAFYEVKKLQITVHKKNLNKMEMKVIF